MSTKFYDKVAAKFGRYHTDHRHTTEYPGVTPEDVFRQKLIALGGKNKAALDLGCGDGRFILSVAPHFQTVTGIDLSKGMLNAANKLQKETGVANVRFALQDADHTRFKDESLDVIYTRRGPTPYTEVYRLLKWGGSFVEITVAEKDTQELQKIFGRGQGFDEWNNPRSEMISNEAKRVGFDISFLNEYFYDEYYPTYQDLDLFLQGVPIFEDYDSERDKHLLQMYVEHFSTDKGVRLTRHRIVSLLRKP